MSRAASATLACVLGAAVVLGAQSPPAAQAPQQPIFRSRLETVAVPVTVLDEESRLDTKLTRDDFTVFDNGKKQTITTFSSGLQPISAVALVDASASMMPVIDRALTAAEQFIIRLRPDDRAKVGLFSVKTWMSPEFTADRDALIRWLRDDLHNNNPTKLLDAIDEAITDLSGETGRRIVIVFTDGCDTASQTSWTRLLAHIRAEDVMVYAVMFQPHLNVKMPPQHTITFGTGGMFGSGVTSGGGPPPLPCTLHHYLELTDDTSLHDFFKADDPRWLRGPALADDMAVETGGNHFVLRPEVEVNRLFTSIVDEMHYLYLLGFTPQTLDGKVHELTVRVNDPTLVVRSRQHYLAPIRAGTSQHHD
jgi:VWFA-related protein